MITTTVYLIEIKFNFSINNVFEIILPVKRRGLVFPCHQSLLVIILINFINIFLYIITELTV